MASTFSPLKFELITTGEQDGTWGDTTNTNIGTAIEQAITGSGDVAFSSADVTLTLSNTASAQTARNLRLVCTGTSGGARQLIVPSIEKQYIIQNNLADTVTIKTSAGSGVAVPSGKTMVVFNNATDVVDVTTYNTSLTVGGTLGVTGNTTLSGNLGVTGTTTLTGNATAQTQTYPDNSTKVATTAYVTTAIAAIAPGFSSGTVLLFYQASAPTGWTQDTSLNDYALRITSSTGGSTGGTTAFSTVFANQTPTISTGGLSAGATTLSTSQIPSHSHRIWSGVNTGIATEYGATDYGYYGDGGTQIGPATIYRGTEYIGGSGSHTHSISGSITSSAITLNVRYANIIICSKD